MSTIEISKHVAELRELRRMASEIAEQISSIENEIKAEMLSMNTDTLNGQDYKITWKLIRSTRFDSSAFKAQYAGLYEAFSKATTAKRFVVA